MWISAQAVVVAIMAVVGAIITAIWGYFSVMGDLRNRDGTVPTSREHWHHILGLLAYFLLGLIVCGGGTVVAIGFFRSLG